MSMADEPKKPDAAQQPEEVPAESNAARLLRAREAESGVREEVTYNREEAAPADFRSRLANFWYHHKWKVILGAAALVIGGTLFAQLWQKSNPDICILYAGPDYITANDIQDFSQALRDCMDDYNGDGQKKVQLDDLVFLTKEQRESAEAEDRVIDYQSNNMTMQQFTYEIMAGDALLCILSEEQYRSLPQGTFLPLSEIVSTRPAEAIDDYAVRLADTAFCRYYTAAQIFPGDAVLALRTLTTIHKIGSTAKMQEKLENHRDVLRRILSFTYPDGYVPVEETAEDTSTAVS